MKSFITLVFFTIISSSLMGQMRHCHGPMPEGMFRQKHKTIAMQRNDSQRLELAISVLAQNCFNAEQVKALAGLFNDDFFRLDFAKQAFESTIDKENFYMVYDEFSTFSTVFMLHDFVQGYERHPHDYLPPSYDGNSNYTNQPAPIICEVTRDQFNDMLQSIRKESFNSTKIEITKSILNSKPCFTTQQVRDIVNEFNFESGKLEIAKYAWDYTLDKENYFRVSDAFSFSSSKEELLEYIRRKQ